MAGANYREVGWPHWGEIDITENVGFDPDMTQANIHTQAYNRIKRTNKGGRLKVERRHAGFHIYAVERTLEKMDFFVDDRKYFRFVNEKTGPAVWPFDRPSYLIPHVTIGGAWGGQKRIDDSIFPQRMQIDYVRVFQAAVP